MKRYFAAVVLVAAAACAKKLGPPPVQVATVARRDIIVDATANGAIEPITVIDVKSKASGLITQMPVETGTQVKPGDLIVQIDTRDVQNKYNQAKAALDAAQAKLQVAAADRKRNQEMFDARVITAQEFEQVAVDYANAQSGVTNAQANLDLAKQSLEDATVRAPSEGTVITKNVAVGTVIASATGSVSGGTTIVQMADLGVVRIRALFNETDIGNVHPGQPANVTVDAYPDRRFSGSVEKIEPQSVVQQNVTMFPVLVNLDNREGLLRPGMNGEVSVLIDEHDGVLAVPNDAIKSPREAIATGGILGLSADTVQAQLKAQGYTGGGRGNGGFGRRGGNGGGFRGAPGGGAPGGGAPGGAPGASASPTTSGGDVTIAQQGQQPAQGGAQGGMQRGGFGMQVSDADCKKIDDVLAKHPKEKAQLDSLRAKMMSMRGNGGGFGGGNRQRPGGGAGSGSFDRQGGGGGGGFNRQGQAGQGGGQNAGGQGGGFRRSPEMQAITDSMNAIYSKLGIDLRTAGACRRQQQGGQGGGFGGGQYGGQGADRGTQGMRGGAGALTPNAEGARPVRPRMGLVFVTDSSKTHFEPRIVQLGLANLDYTEILSGVKEGEHVVMLGALALQAQRQQFNDRMRQNATPLGGGRGGRG